MKEFRYGEVGGPAQLKRTRARVAEIMDTLATGGYDATEGEPGSLDTTWTDFGEVCEIAEVLLGGDKP